MKVVPEATGSRRICVILSISSDMEVKMKKQVRNPTYLNTGKTSEEIANEYKIVVSIIESFINALGSISTILNRATSKVIDMTT